MNPGAACVEEVIPLYQTLPAAAAFRAWRDRGLNVRKKKKATFENGMYVI